MDTPTGIITFLFTDIEGSTKLWEAHTEAMRLALAVHDEILRSAIERHNGYVFKTIGDAFCAAFATAPDALAAALEAQLALKNQDWNEKIGALRVRMGLHTGVAEERDNDYFGPTLNRTARLQGVAHAQQTLLSEASYELVANWLPDGSHLSDLGTHRLKDLAAPEHVWQLLHPSLPHDFAPLKTLDYLPTNLPQQLTSFIGREKEMAEVKDLLEKSRLVTLTGSGGTGKTRLALQSAAEVLEQFADGVWMVELAALSDPGLVAQTVAQALNIRETPGEPIAKTLLSALKDKQMLIVLDNCEHVLDASARLVDAVLKSCSKATVLASSRETLRISGECAYRVPSLSLPDHIERATADNIVQYESVRLFCERARAVNSDFTVSNQNASALGSVCRRIDGIPLAIELAAARVRYLTVEQIASYLDNRFRLLTGGSRTALPRQQTLRAMIDWSYDLLEESHKTMLCRLSVFMGGWTLESAEKICSSGLVQEFDVLDLLTALVDKSLALAEYQGDAVRYRFLETVRQYARDRLVESGESSPVRQRHLDYFLALVEKTEPKLTGLEQGEWLHRLEVEHENLRGALAFTLDGGDDRLIGDLSQSLPASTTTQHQVLSTGHNGSAALRFCVLLGEYWSTRGHFMEGLAWCKRALGDAKNRDRTQERASALNVAGNLAHSQGDYDSTLQYHKESLAISREIKDQSGIANSFNNLGNAADDQGDYGSARTYHQESLAIRRQIGDRRGISKSLNNLGIVASRQGDYASAVAFYEESLEIKQEAGDRIGIANALGNLGNVAYYQGDYCTSRVRHEQSLEIKQEIGDRIGTGSSLHCLGNAACDQGDYASARAYFEQCLVIFRETGHRLFLANTLYGIGMVAVEQGDCAVARTYNSESLEVRNAINDRAGVAASLGAAADLALLESAPERAAVLWGAAEAVRNEIGRPLFAREQERNDRHVSIARLALGEQGLAEAWESGRGMTMEHAIEFALAKSANV